SHRGRACLRETGKDDGVQLRVEALDPRDRGIHELPRRDLAAPYQLRLRRCIEKRQLVGHATGPYDTTGPGDKSAMLRGARGCFSDYQLQEVSRLPVGSRRGNVEEDESRIEDPEHGARLSEHAGVRDAAPASLVVRFYPVAVERVAVRGACEVAGPDLGLLVPVHAAAGERLVAATRELRRAHGRTHGP